MRNNKLISPDKIELPSQHVDSSFNSNLDIKLLDSKVGRDASIESQPSSATPRKISYFGTIHAPNEPFVSYRTNTAEAKTNDNKSPSKVNDELHHESRSSFIPKTSPVSSCMDNKSKFVCFSPTEYSFASFFISI